MAATMETTTPNDTGIPMPHSYCISLVSNSAKNPGRSYYAMVNPIDGKNHFICFVDEWISPTLSPEKRERIVRNCKNHHEALENLYKHYKKEEK
jgi:hypothetical protein